jgi:dephospho-CoA kinase
MFIVALTGGIGCGKTTVTQYFAEHDVPVIDADEISRQLTTGRNPLLDMIRTEFGNKIFRPDGQLDRSALREIVFNDPERKSKLEKILHPAIYRQMMKMIRESVADYIVLSIPLLAEVAQYYPYDRVLVIDCPSALQLSRVLERDNIDEQQALQIIHQQAGREQRLALADDIIDNNGTLEELAARVDELHRQYLELARNRKQGTLKV